MIKKTFISFLCLFWGVALSAQDVEPSRFELEMQGNETNAHFEALAEQGVLLAYKTDSLDENKESIWHFTLLDSSLYKVKTNRFPLSDELSFSESYSNSEYATFLMSEKKSKKAEKPSFCLVIYNRKSQSLRFLKGELPEKSEILSMALIGRQAMIAVNYTTGKGFLFFVDLLAESIREVQLPIQNSFLLYQISALEKNNLFVVAVKEYENKRFVRTSFLSYTPDGSLQSQKQYANGKDLSLGRMCFDFDSLQRLVVYATLERETNQKVDLDGVLEDFNRMALGLAWIRFGENEPTTKVCMFKNMPAIDQALSASDRIKVKEDRVRLINKKKKAEKKEIAFQFYKPELLKFGGNTVFAAEAFVPEYHGETRIDYGFYGSYPYTYMVFDGYDFVSDVLLAFDNDGTLLWQTFAKFDNDLSYTLSDHYAEAADAEELVIFSAKNNNIRYKVLDNTGETLLENAATKVDFKQDNDVLDEENLSGMQQWFGNRYLMYGSQVIVNDQLRKVRRKVFFLQKVQFE